MPASRKEKDSTNHLEHRSINHPAGPKYLKDLALGLGWQPGDKLEVIPGLGGIVIFSSPGGLFTVPVKPCIVIPAAARRIHDIQPGDHVLLAAAPEYGVVIVHTRQAVNEMLARYHSAFPSRGHQHE